MKVTVERAELLRSLSHVHRVVERRNTIPILANVLIRHLQRDGTYKVADEKDADAHIDSLAKKYLNQDKYPFRTGNEKRVTYVIEPASVHVMG